MFSGTSTFGELSIGGGTAGGLGGGGLGGVGGLGGLGGFGLGFGFSQGAARGGGFGGANNFNLQNSQNNQNQSTIRASVKLGFSYPIPSGTARANAMADRIARIPMGADMTGVNIQVDGSTVILTGVVDSESTARRLAGLLTLEPGIYDVQNDLQIATDTTLPDNVPAAPSATTVAPPEVVPVPPPTIRRSSR